MKQSRAQVREIIATYCVPDRSPYPELHEDCSGGGARTMRLGTGDVVLDLGCGKGATLLYLARHFGLHAIALDLWTPATFLHEKLATRGYRDRIVRCTWM